MDIWLAILLILLAALGCGFAGYKYGYKKGDEAREQQILQEFCSYIPIGNVGRIADELMEESGLSPNFPMLVIMPDKYDYLEGVDPKDK